MHCMGVVNYLVLDSGAGLFKYFNLSIDFICRTVLKIKLVLGGYTFNRDKQ